MVCENHIHVVTPSSFRSTTADNSHHDTRHHRGHHAGGPIDMTNTTTSSNQAPVPEELLHPRELEENWQDDANCLGVDPDLFFPERGASTREA